MISYGENSFKYLLHRLSSSMSNLTSGQKKEMVDVRPLPSGSGLSSGISGFSGSKKPETGSSSSDQNDATCVYRCDENGGCSVRIQSSFPISGNTLGSCFSPDFGGQCTGIPERCDNCADRCPEDLYGQEFSESAKPRKWNKTMWKK